VILRIRLVFIAVLIVGQLGTSWAQPPVASQAARAGIKTCLPLIESLEHYLANGRSETSQSFWDDGAPDRALFSSFVSLESNDAFSMANLNVVPLRDGGCSAEYTQTGVAPKSCLSYTKDFGTEVRFVSDMGKRIAMFQGRGVQIYLSPIGPQQCLWVRKELIRQPAVLPHGQNATGAKSPDKPTSTPPSRNATKSKR
jgi:hypothetical protein